MKKIFTVISGLLLMFAFTAKADPVGYVPQTVYGDVYGYDADDNFTSLSSYFTTSLTKDAEGNYVIEDFFNSYVPISFAFEKPAPGETSEITLTGNIKKKGESSYYLMESEDDYMVCQANKFNGTSGWTEIYYPYVLTEASYTYVYAYAEEENSDYEYCATICLNGTVYADDEDETGTSTGYMYIYI